MLDNSATAADIIILVAGALGLVYAVIQTNVVSAEKLPTISKSAGSYESKADAGLMADSDATEERAQRVRYISSAIAEGANSFLFAEYKIMAIFIVLFGAIVVVLVGSGAGDYVRGVFAAIAFVTGAVTSIVSGYIGMKIAVYANVRTALAAQRGFPPAFRLAFRSGAVMGFALTALALLMLYMIICLFNLKYDYTNKDTVEVLFDVIAGYGLGGSSIALFGRVGGGIYTKAADVGADLVGKVEQGIPEDDPRNPGVIADNVGDNVGDIAGMGADLFGSFAEASCAALVVAAHSHELRADWGSLLFPLLISAAGIMVCFVCSFLATNIMVVREEAQIEKTLKVQLWATTLLMTPVLFLLARGFLPNKFCVAYKDSTDECVSWAHYYDAFVCVACGLWSGLAIGLITEYYTSHSYEPVREVARACKTGHATNVIYGLALGYKSVIIPVFALAITIFASFKLCDMFGVALAALGMLSTLACGLTIDAYGPISDNAGGIAEMCHFGDEVRKRTDALDAAGNTTAAIGKGFAIGSAALVSLALFGAFVTRSKADGVLTDVNILEPVTFAALLIGAMLPYWFSAMTMKSVGMAANSMVENIRDQFRDGKIMKGEKEPDYQECVAISTDASLREMILPGALVMLSPIICGIFFGSTAVTGLLAGGMTSGVQMAISASNTGGAWDNAKKYIEAGHDPDTDLRKKTACHEAAVTGDTVGDPLKDTSGPALNILMKLMAIISLVFADFFAQKSLKWGA